MEIIKQARKISLKLSDNNQKHCNKLPFKGTVMKLDTPSEGSPHNTCQIVKPIMLSKKEAMKSANTMSFMGIDCVWDDDGEDTSDDMTGHDARFKIGVISSCYVEGSELKVEGFIYASDFPDIAAYRQKYPGFLRGDENNIREASVAVRRAPDRFFPHPEDVVSDRWTGRKW